MPQEARGKMYLGLLRYIDKNNFTSKDTLASYLLTILPSITSYIAIYALS